MAFWTQDELEKWIPLAEKVYSEYPEHPEFYEAFAKALLEEGSLVQVQRAKILCKIFISIAYSEDQCSGLLYRITDKGRSKSAVRAQYGEHRYDIVAELDKVNIVTFKKWTGTPSNLRKGLRSGFAKWLQVKIGFPSKFVVTLIDTIDKNTNWPQGA